MTVRVASWAFLGMFCALAARGAQAADAPGGTTSPADSLPVATDARLGGDDAQTRFVMDFKIGRASCRERVSPYV